MEGERRLFGTNGIRGVANLQLTPDFAVKVGMAIGTFFQGGRLVLGCDARLSGPTIKMAVASGLCSAGCEVLDVGLAPTPAVEFLISQYRCDGGIAITASHNPPEFNGIKVCDRDGVELPRDKEKQIEEIFFHQQFSLQPWNRVGSIINRDGWLPDYIKMISSHVDAELIRRRRFKVVVDPANSVGALVTPRLLRSLGCDVVTVNGHLDGSFPGRLPEPTPETLQELSKVVVAVGADVGVGHDGDADRSLFVDERGSVHYGDKTFALIAKSHLRKNPGATVVTPISSSDLIREVVESGGGRLDETKVGSIYISRRMLEIKATLGGEENGGIFYGPHQPVRDGAMAAALVLQTIAEEGRSLSKLVSELPAYFNFKEKVTCPEHLKPKLLDALHSRREAFKDAVSVETLDGIKARFSDASWVLIRPSGTEPVFRIFAEAKTQRKAEETALRFKGLMQEIINAFG